MTIHASITGTIGKTPIVHLPNLSPRGVNIFAKLESQNPLGSLKDRAAAAIIEAAEASGELRPGQTVVEASSGNMGISLAMVCAAKGYPLVICMAENFSVERRKLLRFLGASVVLTPAAAKGSGMIAKARELAEANGWFLCRQFENPANAEAHYQHTAQEILADFVDRQLDYFVTGFGTGGTVSGVSRALREGSPHTRIVVCEPDNSPMLATSEQQDRDADGRPSTSHPNFRPHLMQGWSPDFISPLAEDAVSRIDSLLAINGHEALRFTRALASEEGILAGISSGATLAGAVQLAANVRPGSNILCLLPDTGERYLSTILFDGIATEMSELEWELSRSTPSARFDTPVAAAPATASIAGDDDEASGFIDAILGDADTPLVMFAHEWCEFCWSARKAFAHFSIPYRAIDLDSVEYQQDELGLRVRRQLQRRTNCLTIPQVFLNGRFIGGCTECFDAIRDGSIFEALEQVLGTAPARDQRDPHDFLPQWLQPR